MNKIYIGIDPGAKGAIAVLDGAKLHTYKMPDSFPEIYDTLNGIAKSYEPKDIVTVMEQVGQGIPGQSSSATAKFARHNGHLEMALYALGIRTEKVRPQVWEKSYNVGSSKGLTKTAWKNKLKGVAMSLYPTEKITLDTADAILLAHYGKSKEL